MESKFKVGDIVSEEGSDLKYIVKSDVGSRYCLECLDTDPPLGVRGHFKDVAVVLFAKKEMMEKYHKVG